MVEVFNGGRSLYYHFYLVVTAFKYPLMLALDTVVVDRYVHKLLEEHLPKHIVCIYVSVNYSHFTLQGYRFGVPNEAGGGHIVAEFIV